jgi:membrane-associated phospholipid phosphatase
MEMTVIVIALLAAAAGLVVLAASAWRWAAARRQDLLAAGRRVADRRHMQWLPGTCQTLIARVRYVLRPGWLFGTSVVLGLLVIASAAAGAGILVEDVTAGDGMAVLDHPVASFVAAHHSGPLTAVMRAASTAGGPMVLAAVTAVAGVLLGIICRCWGPVLVAGMTVAGSVGLTIVLKEVLGRSRPPLDEALGAADGYAFPSAHAATAAAALGVLAYLCAGRLRSWGAQVAVWAGATTLTALVGISRVYLGVHWMTDVIGGWTFGVLWLAVVVTGWTVFTRDRGVTRGSPS